MTYVTEWQRLPFAPAYRQFTRSPVVRPTTSSAMFVLVFDVDPAVVEPELTEVAVNRTRKVGPI